MIHIYFGDGKGKTTAAVGQGIRASGLGSRVIMVQFQKSMRTGEIEYLKLAGWCSGINLKVIRPETVKGFFCEMSAEDKDLLKKEDEQAIGMISGIISNKECDMLILDEILGSVRNGMLTDDHILKIMESCGDGPELLLTGREASEKNLEAADYITEMKMIRHPFIKGVKASKGIEF